MNPLLQAVLCSCNDLMVKRAWRISKKLPQDVRSESNSVWVIVARSVLDLGTFILGFHLDIPITVGKVQGSVQKCRVGLVRNQLLRNGTRRQQDSVNNDLLLSRSQIGTDSVNIFADLLNLPLEVAGLSPLFLLELIVNKKAG